ncbi:MAG: hypothetical protein CW694_01730 [Candidatus Syntrophoarchaeum sp. WYZ-LMO15]|nr:MAG: hypothetical protein CW694_01730 [Candidatus Syntrophoarchaeum sp. WYZ-LMO15]
MRVRCILLILMLLPTLATPSLGASELLLPMHHIFITPAEDHIQVDELLILKNTGNTTFNGTIDPSPFEGWYELKPQNLTAVIPPDESYQVMLSYNLNRPPSGVLNLTRAVAYDTGTMNMLVPLRGGIKLLDKGDFESAGLTTLSDGDYYLLESYNVTRGSVIRVVFSLPQREERADSRGGKDLEKVILVLALILIALFPNLRDYLRR